MSNNIKYDKVTNREIGGYSVDEENSVIRKGLHLVNNGTIPVSDYIYCIMNDCPRFVIRNIEEELNEIGIEIEHNCTDTLINAINNNEIHVEWIFMNVHSFSSECISNIQKLIHSYTKNNPSIRRVGGGLDPLKTNDEVISELVHLINNRTISLQKAINKVLKQLTSRHFVILADELDKLGIEIKHGCTQTIYDGIRNQGLPIEFIFNFVSHYLPACINDIEDMINKS